MTVILYVFFGLAAVILILLVMIQDEQGEGLGGIFGGGSATPFGSRSGNVLTRFTTIVSAIFFIVCLVIGLVNRSRVRSELETESAADEVNKTFFETVERNTPDAAPAPEASPQPEATSVPEASPQPEAPTAPEAGN